jgi:hypothetical protein
MSSGCIRSIMGANVSSSVRRAHLLPIRTAAGNGQARGRGLVTLHNYSDKFDEST